MTTGASNKHIGQYELLQPLGQGGMSTVYPAYQPSINRYVAIKVIKTNISADFMFIERFNREAQISARLEHPNIVPLYDFGTEADGNLYLVMRLFGGGTLEERLSSTTRVAKDSFGADP